MLRFLRLDALEERLDPGRQAGCYYNRPAFSEAGEGLGIGQS